MKKREYGNPGKCDGCSKVVVDRCGDDRCPDCHISLTWDDCVSGAWTKRVRAAGGMRD